MPQRAFDLALDRLRNFVANTTEVESNGADLAYAAYVLARNGRPVMGDLRYLADTKIAAFGTPLARAQIGAALGAARRPRALAERVRRRGRAAARHARRRRLSRPITASRLRDGAGMLALASEAGLARETIQPIVARHRGGARRRTARRARRRTPG